MAKPKIENIQKPKNFKSTFKKLLVSLKPYSLSIILGLLFSAISTVLAIIGPDQIKKIGTLILKKPIELNEVTSIAIGLLIIYLSSFLFNYLQGFLLSGVTAKLSKDYRNRLSKKINRLPLKHIDRKPIGDVLSRITNDVDVLSETLNNSLSSTITTIATVIGSLVMMLSYSWKLTIIAILI